MARAGIRDRCRVDVSENEDSFVGIRCGTDEISVQFPLGFRVSSDDKELRRDYGKEGVEASRSGRTIQCDGISDSGICGGCAGFLFQRVLPGERDGYWGRETGKDSLGQDY